MLEQTVLIWALWISGDVYRSPPYVAAYFATAQECARVQTLLGQHRSSWSRCIQAAYVFPYRGRSVGP